MRSRTPSSHRRPPLRRCQRCGGDYYAYQQSGICQRCRRATADDARALRELVHERRVAYHGGQLEIPVPAQSEKLFPTDDIPY